MSPIPLRTLRLERDSAIALLTIQRPPVNALGRELVDELNVVLAELESNTWPPDSGGPARALIVTGGGKNFCAGADLKERQGMTEDDVRRWVPYLNGTFQRLARLPIPTIAAINGVAAGGGFELALACDLRVAEEGGQVGLKETSLAILPGAGGTQRLPRLIGPSRAKRWIFTAALYSSAEALADGAVDRIAPAGGAVAEARSIASAIAANGPLAVAAAKWAIDGGFDLPLEAALAIEIRAYERIIPTADRREALAAFVQKRRAIYSGR